MSALLEIKGLWGGYTEGVDILRGIDMEVHQGEAIGIIGLNGSGKSTLGKAIMNMLPIRRGTILFEGEDITPLKTYELSRRGIAIMQQGGKVFPNLSVWDNLQLACNSSQHSTLNTQLSEVVPLLKRPKHELQHLMADKLSGGQRHELALAMALAKMPGLVILDEPSAGLSPKAMKEMYAMLKNIRECFGITILLIEQNIACALEFSDRCVLIQNGRVKSWFKDLDINQIEHILFGNEQKLNRRLYDKNFWNNIYLHHYKDAPWMNDSWKGDVLRIIEQYIPENAHSLLDYGCGNGYMGAYFYRKGFQVDISDISDQLVESLIRNYSKTSIGIYQTEVPTDLKWKTYDVIIAWSIFHHICPVEWGHFLDDFWQILNEGGILVIGGWDKDDRIIQKDGNKARYTGHTTWCVNGLVHMFDSDVFDLLQEDVIALTVPPFTDKRIQHYYILKKITNKK